jgi:hypothetical protein
MKRGLNAKERGCVDLWRWLEIPASRALSTTLKRTMSG